ncbi:MAG: porin family protein [Legionella sp.]|nr:MAG: porin family protein [Legionella sp.]
MKIKTLLLSGLIAASSLGHCGTMMDNSMLNLWEGFYLGGYLGGGWGKTNMGMNAGSLSVSPASYFTSQADINSVNQSGSGNLNQHAFIGGIQAGSNILVKNYIFGLIVDLGSFHMQDALDAENVPLPANPAINYHLHNSVETKWLLTARGNAGVIIHNWIQPYITGGLAVTDLEAHYRYRDSTNVGMFYEAKNGENKAGWTVGGGFQMPINPYLLVNAEYLYVAFKPRETYGIVNCANLSCFSMLKASVDFHANLFKLSMSYRFS